MEWYKEDLLAEVVGHQLQFRQCNISTSAVGVIRGIHFADVPPGQAKYISCVRGALWDVVVDLRVGSPTFGQWESVWLDDVEHRAVYLAEGLGHGFCAMTDGATMLYMCSTTYNPRGERAINPMDPALRIEWPTSAPVLSPRDEAAPTLRELLADGLLPSERACDAHRRAVATGTPSRP